MSSRFERIIRTPAPGDPVAAGSVARPFRQLQDQTSYLHELINAAGLGSTLYLRDQTVESSLPVGTPVFFNDETQQFEAGLAVAAARESDGLITTTPSTQVMGIISAKTNATLADILLLGVASVALDEVTEDGTPAAGLYYLSAASPGKLTRTSQAVAVPVLRRLPDGRVFVNPVLVDSLDRHAHYRFDLVCRPAGAHTPPLSGNKHTISSPDAGLPGWLPASHASFAGKAPKGAEFGYNLSADAALSAIWPPVPISSATLDFDRGLSKDEGAVGVPLGSTGLCVLDRNGIWWMSDCYGDVPWPLDYVSADSSSSLSQSSEAECPRELEMRLTLWFTRLKFTSELSSVLSLRSNDPRLKVFCAGDETKENTTGHLEVKLNLNWQTTEDAPGYQVIKEFDEITGEFHRGPVVSSLFAASDNVVLTGDETDGEEEPGYVGRVGISVVSPSSLELAVSQIRLDGAEQEYVNDLAYLGFAAGREREFRGRIEIPYSPGITSPQLALRFCLLGRASGNLPELTVTARRVPRPPDGVDTPVSLAGADFAVTIDTSATLTAANQAVECESEPFEVEAGDTVFFTVHRDASDGYAAEVGVLRQAGILTSSE